MNTFLVVLMVFCIPLVVLAAVMPLRRFEKWRRLSLAEMPDEVKRALHLSPETGYSNFENIFPLALIGVISVADYFISDSWSRIWGAGSLLAFSVYACLMVLRLCLIRKYREQIGPRARRGLLIEAALQGLFAGIFLFTATQLLFQLY